MQDPVLVLGASGMLGSAISKRLHHDNVSVILHGNENHKALQQLSIDCCNAMSVLGDLSDEDAIEALFYSISKAVSALGGLVFAVAKPFPHKLTHRTSWSIFQEQIDTQLKAAHLCLSSAFPLLKKSKGQQAARVLIVSTEYAVGTPPTKITPYVAAKSALTSYAKVIAQEWLPHDIRVQILAPGMVVSNLTADLPEIYLEQVAEAMPENRLTSADDVADVAAFLMTPSADSLYGTVIPVTRDKRRSL